MRQASIFINTREEANAFVRYSTTMAHAESRQMGYWVVDVGVHKKRSPQQRAASASSSQAVSGSKMGTTTDVLKPKV